MTGHVEARFGPGRSQGCEGDGDPLRQVVLRAVVTFAICCVVAFVVEHFIARGIPGDAYTYLTAGERLNAGHQLYALSPGIDPWSCDRRTGQYRSSPPPFIAVLWRPLAALPGELGTVLWLGGAWTCLITLLSELLRRTTLVTLVTPVPLAFSLVFEFGVGNVNPYLLAGIFASWLLLRKGHDLSAGFLLALLTTIKLTPAVFLVWLAFSMPRRAWAGALAGLAVAAAVSIFGAGVGAHLAYASIAGSRRDRYQRDEPGRSRQRRRSPAAPRVLCSRIVAVMVGGVWLWACRRDPVVGFRLAVILMVVGSPAVYINTFSALLLLIVPWAFPLIQGPPAVEEPSAATTALSSGDQAEGIDPEAGMSQRSARRPGLFAWTRRLAPLVLAASWAIVGLLVWGTADFALLGVRA